jgi:hypothetical protein
VTAASLSAAPGASTALDACLVGTWYENQETSKVIYNGQPYQLVGGQGTTYTFAADGTETVDFGRSQALQGPLGNALYEIDRHGTTRYHATTSGTLLHFSNSDYSGYVFSATLAGRPVQVAAPVGDPPPVGYHCSSTTLTEDSDDFHVGLSRSG